jgi:hypothetical protein
MKDSKFDNNTISSIKVSFCKFKVMSTITPSFKKDVLWVFKNFLTLDGQKLYNEFFDSVLEVGYALSVSYAKRLDYPDKVFRLLSYFRDCPEDEWVPLTCFPSVLFEKKRMDLAFSPLGMDYSLEEVRTSFFNYIMGLDVKKLFIPPPDILYKVGNQLYNDDGVVRKDYEKPSTYRSPFLYQYFLAQPLSPREVWLPDKFTKHNNLFWMIICRQLLKKDPAYPSPYPEETWLRIKGKLYNNIRFDISGFGFQYPRHFLSLMASVIEELYPCDDIMTQSSEFNEILDSVRVQIGMTVVEPPRGIGLGYYEDLKTLCMLALLSEYEPLSVYGDQGLMRCEPAIEGIQKLVKHDFIIKFDKVEFSSTSDGKVKWAGHSMSNDSLLRVKDLTNPLIGCLFQSQHWERKNALISYYNDNKEFYLFNLKKIKKLYYLIFGQELYIGELDRHPSEGGLDPRAKLSMGESKSHIISRYMRPYEDTFFEAPYVTPFKRRKAKAYPLGVSKAYSKERFRAFSRFKPIDSSIYFYSTPRIEYNHNYIPKDRLIPDWADLLYMVTYGVSTGNFTFGLDTQKLKSIAQNYTFCIDPLRAAARGGYKFLDLYHADYYPLGREWSLVLEFLENVQKRTLPYCNRADLPQSLYWSESELYRNTDLTEFLRKQTTSSKKRSRSIAFSESSFREDIKCRIIDATIEGVGKGFLDTLSKAITIGENAIEECFDESSYIADYEGFAFADFEGHESDYEE